MRIGQIAKGNWKSILIALGVGEQYLRNKHGPCPICGGHDRFRWDDQYGQGGYICGGCGGGDGFMLAQKVTGRSFREIAEVIEQQFGQRGDFQATGPNLGTCAAALAVCGLLMRSVRPSTKVTR